MLECTSTITSVNPILSILERSNNSVCCDSTVSADTQEDVLQYVSPFDKNSLVGESL